MTDPNLTALLLVIDRSASMASIRDEMITGLQSMIVAQAEQPGMLTVDVVTFDHEVEWRLHFADPAQVRIELEPRGATALFDALGGAITQFGTDLAKLPEHARPGTVQVIVVTDGGENSSVEWTSESLRAAVRDQTETYGWGFVFLGANQDAALAAGEVGIDAGSALDFAASPAGVLGASASLNAYVSRRRAAVMGSLPDADVAFSDEERTRSLGE